MTGTATDHDELDRHRARVRAIGDRMLRTHDEAQRQKLRNRLRFEVRALRRLASNDSHDRTDEPTVACVQSPVSVAAIVTAPLAQQLVDRLRCLMQDDKASVA